MYLSLNWLKDYVKIPGSISAQEIASRLTMHTVEVEGIEDQAKKFDNVVVGKILEVKKHPNADRLQLAKVDVGAKENLDIVCGAPNIESGQLVPVALVGARLPNGLEIKEAEVRGEKSQGMLCAPDELGLGDDHSGILILNEKAKIGQSFAKHLEMDDTIFEVDNKSLTNRPDLWGHLGMAREISAFLNTKFVDYVPNKKIISKATDSFKIEVKVEDDNLCGRYMAIGMEGIRIEPSPKWMQQRLIAAGSRPINNIVDVTNYVMLEMGQPLHAFDQGLIDKIVVRRAKNNEIIETLDGEKRTLTNEMLVIADSKKPVAIAGVMGGANSEISGETEKIIIESANFDFVSVRKTSHKLALRTESSMRFEKGLDPHLAEKALLRAVELIKELCPGSKIAALPIDIFKEKKSAKHPILLNLDWLDKMIGEEIKNSRVIEILTSLGFGVKQKDNNLQVTVPSWRAVRDISIREDLVEEVARIYGFNNIRSSMPEVPMMPPEKNEERMFERRIKELSAHGASLSEVYNYSFAGEEQLKKLRIDSSNCLRLANPIASHQTLMRQSLAPGLIENIRTNQARYKEIGLFEIGSIYLDLPSGLNKDNKSKDTLPYQEKRLGIILADDQGTELFRKAKGIIEYIIENLNFEVEWRPSEIKAGWAQPAENADISVNGKIIGSLSRLDIKIGKSLGLKKEAVIAEISMSQLLSLYKQQSYKPFQEFDKFPPLVRDLAFVVNSKLLYNDIRQEILKFDPIIKKAELFDIYQGGKLGEKNKSLAFHVIYQADRTLTSEEVDLIQAGLLKRMEEKFEAKIRNF